MVSTGGLIINTLESLLNICNEIKNTSATLDKQKILSREKDNKDFTEMLKFVYDKNTVTGIDKKKLNKDIDSDEIEYDTVDEFSELYDYLKENNTGKDCDICTCLDFINNWCINEEQENFVKSLITKDLVIGINTKIINKVYGDSFIKEWQVQQAYLIDDHPLKPNEWFAISRKANGTRCTFYKGKLLSRQNKEFKGMNHIKKAISDLGLDSFFIDGELIRKNIDNISENENLRIGTGIINTDSDENKTDIQYIIFDIFPLDHFIDEDHSQEKYSVRLQYLNYLDEYLKEKMPEPFPTLSVIERFYHGYNQSKIKYYLNQMDSEGKEGCMINKDVQYQCKRHAGILKVKTFHTVDLKIVGYKEHKNRNRLGSFIVDYKGNNLSVPGYTYEESVDFWNKRDKMLGKIIEVKYKDISTNKDTGLESLQFPVFVMVREDKDTESYN